MTKIKKKPSLQEYDEGWEGRQEMVEIGLIEIGEMIDQKIENMPRRAQKELYRDWKKETNALVELYNERVGFKAFVHVY